MKGFNQEYCYDQMTLMGEMEKYGQHRDIWGVKSIECADGFNTGADKGGSCYHPQPQAHINVQTVLPYSLNTILSSKYMEGKL